MKIQKIIYLIFLSISIQGLTQNKDKLSSVEGPFDLDNFQKDYYNEIDQKLLNGISDKVLIKFLAIPSFASESVLVIESKKNKYQITYQKTEENIWHSIINEGKTDVKTLSWHSDINNDDVELLIELFKTAILNKNQKKAINWIPDNSKFYFSVFSEGLQSAMTYSPLKENQITTLIKICGKIINMLVNNETNICFSNEMVKEINELIIKFK